MIDAASYQTLRDLNSICWAYARDHPHHQRKHCASVPPRFPKVSYPWKPNGISWTYAHHNCRGRTDPCASVSYRLEQDEVLVPPSVVYSTGSAICGRVVYISQRILPSLPWRMPTSQRCPHLHPQRQIHPMMRRVMLQVKRQRHIPLAVHLLP